jgi:RHS repeat-associated protein
VTESYLYDADGARVKKTRGSLSTVYQAGGLVEEDISPSSVRRNYTFNGQVVAQRTVTSAANTLVYLHGDHLGSIAVVSSATGGFVSSQTYTPWGSVRTGGVAQTELNFTGQRKDATGLLFYNARYYDPVLGRFISADTIGPPHGNPQARNRYTYSLNNPLKYTDPTGHCVESPQTQRDHEENARCAEAQAQLAALGVELKWLWDWIAFELEWVLEAIQDMMDAANWSSSYFQEEMGGKVLLARVRAGSDLSGFEDNGVITFYNGAFNNMNSPTAGMRLQVTAFQTVWSLRLEANEAGSADMFGTMLATDRIVHILTSIIGTTNMKISPNL